MNHFNAEVIGTSCRFPITPSSYDRCDQYPLNLISTWNIWWNKWLFLTETETCACYGAEGCSPLHLLHAQNLICGTFKVRFFFFLFTFSRSSKHRGWFSPSRQEERHVLKLMGAKLWSSIRSLTGVCGDFFSHKHLPTCLLSKKAGLRLLLD